MGHFKIGERVVGRGAPTFIIAELSCNHFQDLDIAKATIHAAAAAGADALKLQHYSADTMTLDITSGERGDFWIHGGTEWDGGWLYDLYREASTPWEWTAELKALSESLGMTCFSTPFDCTAADLLATFDMPAYKIASFEANDVQLLAHVAKLGKPVIFSTGMCRSVDQLRSTVDILHRHGCFQIAILKCCSSYPAKIAELNLETIRKIRDEYPDIVVGLSDHTRDNDVIIASVALGAKIIERHIILDRSWRGKNGKESFDKNFSLEPNEFEDMVVSVRKVEAMLGNSDEGLRLGTSQTANLQFTRSLYFAADLPAGTVLTAEHIRCVRPGWGDIPANLPKYLGKCLVKPVSKGTRADLSYVE